MLSTYITTYFPSKQNVWQYPYKQGWTKKKIVCSFVYFTQLCIYISNKMHCFPAHISAKHNICRLISMVLSMLAHSLNPHWIPYSHPTCAHNSLNALTILSAVMQAWVRDQAFHWKKVNSCNFR